MILLIVLAVFFAVVMAKAGFVAAFSLFYGLYLILFKVILWG